MAGEAGEIRQWLEDFSAAVRAVDYERGMTMFAPEVVGFGTYASMLVGLDKLVAGQWKNIWGVTRGFAFRLDELHCGISGDQAWVAAPWTSQGKDAAGEWYDRPGRATLILERRDGRWLCVHSHLSLYPRLSVS
jgi:ketosteroid isomerase-like protein